MARNIEFGEDNNLIPFNCYRGVKNEKGRLVRELKPYDRIYCSLDDDTKSANNTNNVIRMSNVNGSFRTRSDNSVKEDDYIENTYTGEIWKVESVTRNPLNNTGYENSRRISYETILVCGR